MANKNNSKNTRYRVFIHETVYDWNGTHEVTRLLGETWAASAARAISNVKYRLGFKKPVDTLYGPTVIQHFHAENVLEGGNLR